MRAVSTHHRMHLSLMAALMSICVIALPLCAWHVEDVYTASGSRTTGYWPTSNEMIYVVAQAPANGAAVSQFIQGTTHRATANAADGATACDHGMIYTNWVVSQLETSATVISGTAKCYGWNASDNTYKDRVFCSNQQN